MAASSTGTVRRAPVGLTVALAVVLAMAGWAVVMAVVLIVDRPTPLPPPFPSQNQDAETLAYLLAFAVILPAGLVAAAALANAVVRRSGVAALSALTAGLAASLAAAVAAVRLAGALGAPDGVKTVLVAVLAWWVVAAAALMRAGRPRPWPLLARIAPFAQHAWALAAAVTLAVLLCFTDLGAISPVGLAAGAVVVAAAIALAVIAPGRLRTPRLSRPWKVALELAVVVAILLAVPDLLIFRPEQAAGNLGVSLETSIIRFHQDFLLGPANEVLGGGTMLVDTASQYGVGSIYLLVGWFLVAPIGYGTFGLLDGILTAGWFAAGYAVLRVAGVSRTVSASALAVAVVALVFNLTYPVGALPQYGPLRFGMPMAVILALVAAQRWPRASRPARAAALAVAGISAIFSLEALVYTTAVYGAVLCAQAWLRPGPRRLRWLVGQGALVVAAWVLAHIAFAALTLAAAGQLPDWGQYLAYLHVFLFGAIGNLTYDVPRWSPGLAVGAAYLASAAALIELMRRRDRIVARERTAVIALTGLTAYGIVLLSYWVNRSQEHILVHVALPALLMAALWLSVLLRARKASQVARLGGLAVAGAVGVIVVACAWPQIGDRFPRSALAHAAPGGQSLRGALQRLWHPPALDAAAPAGERLLGRYLPAQRRSLVITEPDLGIEILIRSGRVDRLFLGDPQETSFVAGERIPDLRRQLATLRPGERMLLDGPALVALRALAAHPSADPLRLPGQTLAPLQVWALAQIQRRFRLRTVARADGFTVVQLAPRAP